jgi:hypothetical protein
MIGMLTKLFCFTTLVLMINGCTTSNLSYNNEQLSLQIKDSHLEVHGTQLKQQRENFSTLFLTQYFLRLDDGSKVVYEKAKTDIQYEFEPTTARSISIIFDAKKVIKVYYNTLVYAFQVVLQDNRVLNVLATQGFDQELNMIYGMSTEKLNSMLINLDPNVRAVYYKNTINLSNESEPFMSRWTTRKVHFIPLVVPVRRFFFY